MELHVQKAAEAIGKANFLLVAAGAGFSADSGLPVYNDIANIAAYDRLGLDYQDLCDPDWFHDDLELAQGFWGDCFNLYRSTSPHEGYRILNRWRTKCCDRGNKAFMKDLLQHEDSHPSYSPFFIYTSNVDAHFRREFDAKEIYEIHGNVEKWQCAGKRSKQRPCHFSVWDAPKHFEFQVDPDTRNVLNPMASTFLSCASCKGAARPNVLMFRDKAWIRNTVQEQRYVAWERMVETALKENPHMSAVVLEIGCGVRVPSVRLETETVVRDVWTKSRPNQIRLVRINPEHEEIAPHFQNQVDLPPEALIQIKASAIDALHRIDACLAQGSFC